MTTALECYSYDTINMEWFSSLNNYNLDPISCSAGYDICYVKFKTCYLSLLSLL